MTRHSLAHMPLAVGREDGKAVLFKFVTHSNEEFEFECPPEAIPEIVARLTAALEEVANKKLPLSAYHARPLEICRYETLIEPTTKLVVLRLFPTPRSSISFVVPPDDAQQLSSMLAEASAKAAPRRDKESLS